VAAAARAAPAAGGSAPEGVDKVINIIHEAPVFIKDSSIGPLVALPPEFRTASAFLGGLELGVPGIERQGLEEMAPPYLVLKMVQCSKQDRTVLRTTC
jgi:hypothetical protein